MLKSPSELVLWHFSLPTCSVSSLDGQLACLLISRINDIGASRDTYRSTRRCRLIAYLHTRDQSAAFAVDRGPQPRGCKAAATSVVAGPRVFRKGGRVSRTGRPNVSLTRSFVQEVLKCSEWTKVRLVCAGVLRAKYKPIESLCAVDHSARGSMKNAAKCET